MQRLTLLALCLLLVSGLAAACGALPGGASDEARVATAEALRARLTVEAGPAESGALTEMPPQADGESATETPAGAERVAAARETATAVSLGGTATAVARATQAAVDAEVAAATLAPIEAELRALGVDPAAGRLGWVHPPVELFVEGYLQYDWDVDLVRIARDFVVVSDITWNTQFGSTGCGYVVRSDGDEEAITQHLIVATRGGNGRVLFGTQIEGNLVMDDSEDIYANGIDPLFEWQNDTTNRIAVVARGDTFQMYSNGTYLGDITVSEGPERGFVAFVALNESGTTDCRFDNAYLWLLE